MSIRRILIVLIVGGLLVAPPILAGDGKGKGQIDVVPVVEHGPTPPGVFGTSHLLRTPRGIAFMLNTTALVPGDAYTLWLFIDESDATAPAPAPALERFEIRLRIDGEFAAPDGSAGFSGFLPKGALPAADGISVLATDDGFFDDPMNADVLLLVRAHGPAIPGMEYVQTHNVFGGCPPNNCVTVQEALHGG